MRKSTKNALISIIGASFIAVQTPMAAYADVETDNEIRVNIRIEGISECLYYDDVIYLANSETAAAAEIIKFADIYSDDIEISWTHSDYGDYISAVNGEMEGAFGGWEGWQYMVNGESPAVGVSACEIKSGDEIVIYYGDSYGVGMQYPVPVYDYADGTLTLTSLDLSYDADWNPIETENPVTGVKIELYGDETYILETDENGCADLAAAGVEPGNYKLSYSKYAENGIPMILRPDPDCMLEYGYILGDVDNSGGIDALDASMVLTAYANTATSKPSGLDAAQELSANVCDDAAIDALDASVILSYYAYSATGGQASLHEYLSASAEME